MAEGNRGHADLRSALAEGKTVVGTIVNIVSPAIVEAVGWAGLDFVWIDGEHGPMGIESIESMVRAAEVSGTTPVVRVSRNDRAEILHCLDVGAVGVHVPDVRTAEDAEKAVDAIKYHPRGSRGLSLSHRSAHYGQTSASTFLPTSNKRTFLVVHIEDGTGLENADKILAVDGVDVAFLGIMDLSQSLGVPGDVNHPLVKEGVEVITRAAKAEGKALGAIANTLEQAIDLQRQGIRYIVVSTVPRIVWSYLKQCREAVAASS